MTVLLHLHPNITDEDHSRRAKLLVQGKLNNNLLKKISEDDMNCSVKVIAQIKDRRSGITLQSSQKEVRLYNGQVNFFQDLLSYDRFYDLS